MPLLHARTRASAAGNPRGGQALIFATLTLTVMFGTLGLATDLGWNYFLKARVQTAADAAASAAAVFAAGNSDTCSTVTCGVAYTCAGTTPPTTSLQAGCLYGTADGPPILTATMIENNAAHPPSGLTGVSPTMWVQATVTASNSNHFLFLSGFHTASILASSIAGVATTGSGGNGSCLYALSSSGTGITDGGSGVITTSCGIADNGGLSYAASGNIRANCTSPHTCPIYVNGVFSDTSSGNISSSTAIYTASGTVTGSHSGSITPGVTAGTTTVTDPFANVTPPTVGPCTATNYSYTGSGPVSLTPGVYCGGMQFAGSGRVTFAAGTYIINGTDGNGKSFDYGGSGSLDGSAGVTFFVTGKNGYTAGPVAVAGSGDTLAAPASGSLMGLLFYQDPSVTYAGANSYSGSGNVTGSMYFPTTTLNYSGSGNALAQALVANKLVFTGSGNFTQDTTGTLTGINRSVTTVSLIQ
jgi:Putative Flp pilus-assembly TadE/G-like